ncbi:hypothetical protein BKA93DRAFT_865036, partial [Sparassis latifolia]
MDTFDEDWNEFNDINKVVIHQRIRTEYKVAFLHLHNSLPRSVHISPYHSPKMWIFARMIPTCPPSTSIPSSIQYHFSHEDMIFRPNDADDDDFELEPLLEEKIDLTADAIALWWAPDPYSRRSGRTRRAQDIPLVKNW